MGRPPFPRNVGFLPRINYFKPAGVRMAELEEIVLGHDEVEALRLKDLMGLSQEEAARQMNVSQPTFHRLLLTAHAKMADAVINSKALRIEGGNFNVVEEMVPPCGWRRGCRHGWKGWREDGSGAGMTQGKGGTMKIAVTSSDGTLEGMVDERFGRSRKLIIYDTEKKSFDVVDNTQNMNAAQGAGIQSAQNVVGTGARAVISGHLGPNAFRVLSTAGVDVYTVSNRTVADAIVEFEAGKLARMTGPDVNGHW
jgi:predicted DNA-binding protein (UPF0251 family)/predicted Fe-Mo cluster-binding NifX family protein